jgi:trimeric autotransporter adhesin
MHTGRIRRRYGSPLSTKRKSPTSAWRRSLSSTKKTSETPARACNLLLSEPAAAVDTAAEDAEAAGAFEPAEGAALEAAAAAEAAASASAAAAGEAAEAAGAVAVAPGAGAGAAAAACRGEAAPSGARLERLAVCVDATGHRSCLTALDPAKDFVCSASPRERPRASLATKPGAGVGSGRRNSVF